jgi:CRISPR-associated protein Cas2
MAERALHIVAYDVAHPRRLARALRTTRAHATGGQKSAHECWLTGTERKALLGALRRVLHPPADRLLAIRLDPGLPPRLLGIAVPPEAPGMRIIG